MYLATIEVVGNLAKDATITKTDKGDKIALTVIDNTGMNPETYPVVVYVKSGEFDNRAQHFSKGKSVTVSGEIVKLETKPFNGVMIESILVQCFGNKSVFLNSTGNTAPAANQPANSQPQGTQQAGSGEQSQSAPQAGGGSQADDHNQQGADLAHNNAPAPDFDSFDDDIPF
jgi:single-stranded DNA-binding protein